MQNMDMSYAATYKILKIMKDVFAKHKISDWHKFIKEMMSL